MTDDGVVMRAGAEEQRCREKLAHGLQFIVAAMWSIEQTSLGRIVIAPSVAD
jgi:hypothetical protein